MDAKLFSFYLSTLFSEKNKKIKCAHNHFMDIPPEILSFYKFWIFWTENAIS